MKSLNRGIFLATALMAGAAMAQTPSVHPKAPTVTNGSYDQTTITPFTIGTCNGEGPGCSAVYGMDWLSDGRMVLLTSDFQAHNPKPRDPRPRSKVSLISGLPNGPVTVQDIATHFKLPAGVVVVNDKIWVTDMDTVYTIPTNSPDTSGNAAADSIARMNNRQRRFGAPLPTMYNGNVTQNHAFPEGSSGCWVSSGQSGCTNLNSHSHHYIFTPFYYQGKFYASYGGATQVGNGKSNLNSSSFFAGALLSWDSTTTVLDSTLNRAAGGFRSPAGSGMGPDGTIFVGDNQGSWLPLNTITRIKPFTNQFAGYNQEPGFSPNWAQEAYRRGIMKYEPPIAINRYDQSNKTGWVALGQPYYLSKGHYAGDLLVGDINSRGLWRVALDTLNDTTGAMNVQGAVFYFTPGNSGGSLGTGNNGMIRITQGSDGTIYAGALRGVGNWGMGPASNMLYVFKPKATPTHLEVRRIRSIVDGYELILNKKVNPATLTTGTITVGQRAWVRKADYGLGFLPDNNNGTSNGAPNYTNRPITGVSVSADSMRIRLIVPGIKRINQGRIGDSVTHWHTNFTLARAIRSTTGDSMFTTEAAYAQNWISNRQWVGDTLVIAPWDSVPTDTVVSINQIGTTMLQSKVWISRAPGSVRVHVDNMKPYVATLRSLQGRIMGQKQGKPGIHTEFTAPSASQAVYTLEIFSEGERYSKVITF